MFDPDLKLKPQRISKAQVSQDQRLVEKLSHVKQPQLKSSLPSTTPLRVLDQEEVFKFYFKSSAAIRELYGYRVVDGHLTQVNGDALKDVSETRKSSMRDAIREFEEEAKKHR